MPKRTNSKETDEKVAYIFDTLAETDVGITAFANSLKGKVSRCTLQHWKQGGYINDQLRLGIAFKKAKRLWEI
jgi:hypothetical protein